MNKRLVVFLLILALATFSLGCSKETDNTEQEKPVTTKQTNISDTKKNDSTGQGEGKKDNLGQGSVPATNPPHSFPGFSKDKAFSGGQEVENYVLSNIRRAPHPEFTRLIFDFSGAEKALEANLPPKYEISYQDDTQTLTAVFKGVSSNTVKNKVKEIQELAPIIDTIQFEQTPAELKVTLKLKEKVSYQMFELSVPARIAVVLNPDKGVQQ